MFTSIGMGEPTLISAGALLENIELAAPAFGLKSRWEYAGSAEGMDRIAVNFSDDSTARVPELFDQIRRRSVDRRPFRMRHLDTGQKRLSVRRAEPGHADPVVR